MQLLYFDDYRLGLLKDGMVIDMSSVVASIPHVEPQEIMSRLIARFGEYRPRLEQAAASARSAVRS